MSETCIVCLGDLGEGASELHSIVTASPDRNGDNEGASNNDVQPFPREEDDGSGNIAHLLPCGHNLHNDCLKPWVERANSCPICRQSFNVVELSEKVGGE